jgi:hypothetical protein
MKTSDEQMNEALKAALRRKFDNFGAEPEPGALAQIRAQLPVRKNWKYLFLTFALMFFSITAVLVDQNINYRKPLEAALNVRVKPVFVNNDKKPRARSVASNPLNVVHRASLPARTNVPPAREVHVMKVKKEQMPDSPAQAVENELIVSMPVTSIHPEMLESGTVKFDSLSLPEVEKDIPTVVPFQNAFNTKHWKWLINVAALESYQILTVPASAASHFQHFELPRALSLKSIGYKLSLGAEKQGFQFRLSYSNLRQRYAYEVAGNEFVIKNDKPDSYRIVRAGERVEVDRKMDLIGFSLAKKIQWGRSSVSRYFAAGGVEYARALNARQQLGFVNFSVGKQFLLSRKVVAELGPFAEISPFKIKSDQNPFLSQPYRVGVSLGVAFAP